MRIAAVLSLAALAFVGCSPEEDSPERLRLAAALEGEYRWVESSFSAGGPSLVDTPESIGEERALVITGDSLLYLADGRRRFAQGYRSLGEVSWPHYAGLAVEAGDVVDGQERRVTLATDLKADGTLVVFPIDPVCVEGCADVYERIND